MSRSTRHHALLGAALLLTLACGSRSGLLLGSGPAEGGASTGGAGGVGGVGSSGGVGGSGGVPGVDAASSICPPGTPPVELASGMPAAEAYGIALDPSFVFFTRAPFDGAGEVLRVPKLGGALLSLAASESRPRFLAVGAEHVVFTSPLSGRVKRVRKDGSELTVLADMLSTPEGIALDEESTVYWVTGSSLDGKLMRLEPNGGSPEVLVDHINSTWALELREGWLYFTAGSTSTQVSPRLMRFHESWLPGTPPELLALVEHGSNDISVDDTHVYFTSNVALGRVPLAGGSAEILFDSGIFLRGVEATATHVYFVESGGAGAAEGNIYRYAKSNGELVVVASGQHMPRHVSVDDECAYWTNSGFQTSGGAVMRGPR